MVLNRIKSIIYDGIQWLATLLTRPLRDGKPRLLIVRVDEIGDYMLWRPFLNTITEAPVFRNHEIHFCGNQSWKSLFDTLDARDKIHTHWLDKTRFKKDMSYRLSFLRSIRSMGFDIVINPTFSRDKRNDDSIVAVAGARQRLGMQSNRESLRAYDAGYDRRLYTQLFHHPEFPLFEFTRNSLFTEFITGHTPAVSSTEVPLEKIPAYPKLPEAYFVVFPGSRSASRIWPAEHFATVANWLHTRYGYTAVVCGAPNDRVYTQAFCAAYQGAVLDLTAQTSLPQMLGVLKHAKLLLSVDTGSVHLAAAVACPVYGVFNGSQYGRFAPYPPAVFADFHAAYPDAVANELGDMDLVRKKYEFVVNIPYASVSPEQVIRMIEQSHH